MDVIAKPDEALRRALKNSKIANGDQLDVLGPVYLSKSEVPGNQAGSYVIIDIGDVQQNGMTNRSENHVTVVTIKLYGVSQEALRFPAALARAWIRSEQNRLGSGNLTAEGVRVYGVKILREGTKEIGTNSWRSELDFRVNFGIPRIG